ncbi:MULTISPECIES: hypothetical protein [Actinoplanes]|uniref:hypothetical protein n=1 Tax=Actinoplanes TaxID=1865 RepID=UPI0012FAFD7A|nr:MULTISPECIES: hypothetical protein [Actinoplanes]
MRKTGSAVQESVIPVRDAVGKEDGRLFVTGPASEWDTGRKLTRTALRWIDYLTDLSQRVEQFGTDLVRDADDYQAADEQSAAEIYRGTGR